MNLLNTSLDLAPDATAQPAAVVLGDGNCLRLFRRMAAGTKLYEAAPQPSAKEGQEIQKLPEVRAALLAYQARPSDEEAADVVRTVLAAKAAHSP